MQSKLKNKQKELDEFIQHTKNNNILLENQIREQFKTTYKEKFIHYNTIIDDCKSELTLQENKLNTTKQHMYEEINKKVEEKETVWMNRINEQQLHYEKLLEEERNKREKLIIRDQNSTIKGIDGEDFTLQELNKRFPTSEIEDTHKESNRGDFIIKIKNMQIMIENKNYSRNVPKVEIEKFYSDIKNNADINGGVFVSLKSGICKKEDFQLEIIEGKPIVFLHKLLQNMDNITKAVMIIQLICDKECIDLNNKEILDKLKNFSPTLKRNLSKMKKSLKKHENDMLSCLINQEQIVKEVFNMFKIKY